MQSMDLYLSYNNYSDYYENNYRNISFESDARIQSFIDTCRLVKDYPDLQLKAKKIFEEKNECLKNKTRKSDYNTFTTVIHSFKESINQMLIAYSETCKENNMSINSKNKIKKIFDTYPALSLIFTFDESSNEISFQTEECLMSKLSEFRNSEQSPEQEDAIYCLENILYDIKLGRCLDEYFLVLDTEGIDDYSSLPEIEIIDDIENEIVTNVGLPPQRR